MTNDKTSKQSNITFIEIGSSQVQSLVNSTWKSQQIAVLERQFYHCSFHYFSSHLCIYIIWIHFLPWVLFIFNFLLISLVNICLVFLALGLHSHPHTHQISAWSAAWGPDSPQVHLRWDHYSWHTQLGTWYKYQALKFP